MKRILFISLIALGCGKEQVKKTVEVTPYRLSGMQMNIEINGKKYPSSGISPKMQSCNSHVYLTIPLEAGTVNVHYYLDDFGITFDRQFVIPDTDCYGLDISL
jgi:hypothetical protein